MSLVTSGPQLLSSSASDAVTTGFIARVAAAASSVAQAVLTDVTSTTPRVNYARQVQANPQTISANSVAWAVVADNATGTGSSDQLILDRVAALWDNLAKGY